MLEGILLTMEGILLTMEGILFGRDVDDGRDFV